MRRRELLKTMGLSAATAFLPRWAQTASEVRPRPNVLFICTDDLNDWVGCLGGRSDVRTPNIDRLAKRGVLFTNAHCPAPLCNPCRTAIMTGLRPSTTGIHNNNAVWAKKMPDWVTLPRHFKHNGYHAAGAGKIYHHTPKGFNPKDQWHEYFDPYRAETVALPAAPQDDLDDLPPAAAKIAQAGRDKRFKMVVECGELRPAVRGYLSSISHADTLVGGLLRALDESSYAQNTIIVFWPDHGYHFGEKQRMAKRSLWERATRVPLIVVAPGITKPGGRCSKPVDLMALYPTLVELCGLPPRKKIEGDTKDDNE